MGLDVNKNPFLYSAGTQLAYNIAKRYYHNIHYVWCTTEFDSLMQPPTSNPATICMKYLKQISTGDRHAIDIKNNIAGILRGAKEKFNSGVISKKEYNEIRSIVSVAKYEAFFPVLYIIESKMVIDSYNEVALTDKASLYSVEYKITDLQENEFEIIQFKDVLYGVINIVDEKAGE